MKPLSSRDIDPRVFVPNFAMQDAPPALEPLDVPSPEPTEDDAPMEELESPEMPEDEIYDTAPSNSYGPERPYVEQPIEIKRRPEAAATADSNGAFCSIYEDAANPGDWYLRGGSVPAVGDQNFSVPAFLINSTDNTYRIYIPVNVEINRTTDGNYFMPDVKTSSDTSLAMVETTGAYPSNTLPTIASLGVGLIHLLVAEVEVSGGIPTVFSPTGCGSFHIESCLGSLTYRTR